MPWYVFLIPVAATLLGGALAIRWRAQMDLLIAASTGLLLGATSLDLLPEAAAVGAGDGYHPDTIVLLTLAAFLLFFTTDKLIHAAMTHSHRGRRVFRAGHVGASLLIFHSFRDGMAIGAAFAASHHAGYIVALAIAAHDLGDGMNTVLLTTRGETAQGVDYVFLVADAVAPCAGGLLMERLRVSPDVSVLVLSLAAGFFIQLIAGEFLPQLRRSGVPRTRLALCALSGFTVLLLVNFALRYWVQ